MNMTDNKEFAARLMAVQACYQNLQNQGSIRGLAQEYMERGLQMDEDGLHTIKPQGVLFKKILSSLDHRIADIEDILKANIHKTEAPKVEVVETNVEGEADADTDTVVIAPPMERTLEPLLKAILLCGISELLEHQDIDAPLIIDDYLNVTHSFYEKQQVAFVNGILDKVSSLVRS